MVTWKIIRIVTATLLSVVLDRVLVRTDIQKETKPIKKYIKIFKELLV